LLDRADSLDRVAFSSGLEQAASQLGLTVQTAQITPALPIIPEVGPIQEGLEWALEDADVGEVSEVFETPSAFYVLGLINRQEEGILTLEEATPTIRSLLENRARIERARELLADAVSRARRGEPLEQI